MKRAAALEVELARRGGSRARARATAGRRRSPGSAEHDALERGGDRAGVGDVVAEVGAVVDPRDDQLGLEALDQAELGEAHAVHRVPSVA